MMRGSFLGAIFATLALVSCGDDDVIPPEEPGVQLIFASERDSAWSDPIAYVTQVDRGRVEFVGFYSACSHEIDGRLVKADDRSIVVDVEVSQVVFICIVGKDSKYSGTLTGVPPGARRIILEQVVRNSWSGELIRTDILLDTTITVP